MTKSLRFMGAALLLMGGLLWGQTQSAPGEMKEKKVLTEDDLVASRPADFVPSQPDAKPEGEQPAASSDEGSGQAKPVASDKQAQIAKLKQQEEAQQARVAEYQAKLDAATTPAEKSTYAEGLESAKQTLSYIQQTREALEQGKPAPTFDQQMADQTREPTAEELQQQEEQRQQEQAEAEQKAQQQAAEQEKQPPQ